MRFLFKAQVLFQTNVGMQNKIEKSKFFNVVDEDMSKPKKVQHSRKSK
jgi:hypothetical protein